VREYEAPLLGELLKAALDGEHLKVTYDSIRSGVAERVVYPFGLYASQGFWYCACFDHKRRANVTLRADRFFSAERVRGFERPPHVPLDRWAGALRSGDGERVRLRVHVSERGAKSFELVSLLGQIQVNGQTGGQRSGIVEADIPRSEIDFYASRLLSVGAEVRVESPSELVEACATKRR
jgi:predicted DNA-binding transcriptional regulator YafY